LRIAANVKQNRRIIDLEKCLRIFRLSPIDEPAAVNVAGGGQLFFGALESFFLDDGLSDWSRQAASFKLG
jgi:hypothetical protein